MRNLVIAWRNMWRNPRRAGITVAAVAFNTAILIITYSLMNGLMFHMLANATNMVTGEAQIHVPGYLSRQSLYQAIENPEKILDALREQGISAAARSYGYGLVAHDTKSAGALFWGVDPMAEKTTFDLHSYMEKGGFLSPESNGSVVLGKKLAKTLKVTVGSELVVVVQAADGSLGNELFTVCGILKSVGESMDRGAAILHRDDFDMLFVAGKRVHEIAVNTRGSMDLNTLAQMAESASSPDLETKTWRELLPALSDMMNIFDVTMLIFGSIFILAGGMGVMNTMFMATFERLREFGIIKALGATPFCIVKDVVTEAFVLSVFAAGIGVIIGSVGSWYLSVSGIDTSVFSGNYSFAGVAIDPLWRAVVTPKNILIPFLLMPLVCVVASLYPAVFAARLDPVRAINHV